MIQHLKSKSLTGSTDNTGLDRRGAEKSVFVWNTGQGTLLSLVAAVTKIVVIGNSISVISAVKGLLVIAPDVRLNENLGTVTGVDAIGDGFEVGVVDVSGTKTERWSTGVDVEPVVVGVGNVEVSSILIAIAVRVTHEGSLPVVVDIGVGNGDVVRSMGDVNEAIVVVLVVVTVGRDIDVIDPDVRGVLDSNGITVLCENLLDKNVTDDNILLLLDQPIKEYQSLKGQSR